MSLRALHMTACSTDALNLAARLLAEYLFTHQQAATHAHTHTHTQRSNNRRALWYTLAEVFLTGIVGAFNFYIVSKVFFKGAGHYGKICV